MTLELDEQRVREIAREIAREEIEASYNYSGQDLIDLVKALQSGTSGAGPRRVSPNPASGVSFFRWLRQRVS